MKGLFTLTRLAAACLCVAATASAQLPAPGSGADLAGTWQLVRFQGTDDTSKAPEDRGKYTIEFRKNGSLVVRLDCNRGRGTWTSPEPGRLELGPLAITRAMCGPGSMHDQIVKHWSYVRSYVLKQGHLFLSLMADGGIYEFEPLVGANPTT